MSSNDFTADQFPRKFGNYLLLAPLAQGGMGALYLAVRGDRGFERLLVIKTVLPHLADAEYIARFRDEAKVVVKLSHGNLIPVFDAGQVDGELFLAMDFVEGRDLRAVWNRCAKKQVAFPIDVAVYITKELCRGLAYAHSFGNLKLVHRDISPPNILMSYSGEVKLTDFGLASSTMKMEKTAPGIIYGKVAYMSPEQARGEPLDGRSDLYAAAIVLWELLTGRQLFPPGKDQPHDLLQRARNPMPTPPSKRAPRVPADLDAICLKALAPSREDRYANGDEMREALSAWLAAEAPGTDANRVEAFLYDLFAEDIQRERQEREELLEKARTRVSRTLPPASDELEPGREDGDTTSELERKVARAPGSVGRRAADRGAPQQDRRQSGDRRKRLAEDGEAARADSPNAGDTEAMRSHSDGAEAPSGAASVGQVIDGRYRIKELIGEGGMGRVYLAEHVEIGRRVAIKILHPVYSRMPDLVERFRREARAASKIGHPNIVDVTDSGTTDDGSVYFVMEYLEGVELGSVIAREGALEVNRCLHIGIQMCRALSAAHAVGIIHRDLKPENIFLTTRDGATDFVKVLDFGIAKSMESEQARARRLTSPGMAMGTPEYMAPEQAAGRPADQRSDIYAVGAILYESLTGMPPYDGDNFMEILTKKATVEPTPPHELRRDLAMEVSELILRAMARNPGDRPASMEAFEYELNKCLSGRGAAVAKVLGMSTDPGMMSGLGMPVRPEEGAEARRPVSQPPAIPPPVSKRPPSQADIPMPPPVPGSSPDIDLPAIPHEPTDNTDTVVPVSIGSRRAVLLMLGALAAVLIGVGAILFLATGSGSDSAQASAAIDAAASGTAQSADAAVAAVGVPGPEAGNNNTDAAPEPDEPDAAPDAAPQKNPSPRIETPTSDAEAKEMLARAKDAEKSSSSQARRIYDRVASSKYRRGDAYLGLARMALRSKSYPDAIKHASSALREGASPAEANRLLGRAYMEQDRQKDARRYFEAVLRYKPGDREATQALEKLGGG